MKDEIGKKTCEDGIEKSVLRDQSLSSLEKPRDAGDHRDGFPSSHS